MESSDNEIVVMDSSTSLNSSDDEPSLRLASKSKHWIITELHQGILDALDELKYYSYNNFLKKKGKEGDEYDTFINKKLRTVRIITSRLTFKAAKLEKQVSSLKQENIELQKCLLNVEKKNNSIMEGDCGIVKNDGNSLSFRSGFELEIADYIAEKMEDCVTDLVEKIQPIIRAEVQNVCVKTVVTEESTNREFSLDSKSMYNDVKMEDGKKSFLETPPTNTLLALDDLQQFPALIKKSTEEEVANNNTIKLETDLCNFSRNKISKVGLSSIVRLEEDLLKDANKSIVSRNKNEQIILIKISKECGLDFNTIVMLLKKQINLKADMGIETLCMRKTSNGGKFIVRGNDAIQKAELLAAQMNKILSVYKEAIVVSCPRKNIELFVSGKNDLISLEEIENAFVINSGCRKEDISVGKVFYKSFGRWSVRVTCPQDIGYTLCKLGRLRVGWGGWATVKIALTPLIRCFRCLRTGHTRVQCKEVIDRSLRCYRCGDSNHQVINCKHSGFRCPLCIDDDKAKDSKHKLGDVNCICPSFSRVDNNNNNNIIKIEDRLTFDKNIADVSKNTCVHKLSNRDPAVDLTFASGSANRRTDMRSLSL